MYLYGVIFQADCVYFEIKKEQIATPFISDYSCFQMVLQHCVNFEITKEQIATPLISDYFCI
jgi:hypothetical protein